MTRSLLSLLLTGMLVAACGAEVEPGPAQSSSPTQGDVSVTDSSAASPEDVSSDDTAGQDGVSGADIDDSSSGAVDVDQSSDTGADPTDAGDPSAGTDASDPEVTDTADGTSDTDGGIEPGADVQDDTSTEDVPPPPLEPTLLQANTTWEVTTELLLEGDFTYAWDPTGQELVVQSPDGAVYFSPPGQVSAPLETSPGTLQAQSVVPMVDASSLLMLASDEGLFVRVEDELVLSPLDALLPSAPIQLLTSGPPLDAWLWLAMTEGLWVFNEGAVYAVEPEEISTGGAAIAFGAPVDGVPSLWGVNGSGTWALSPSDDVLNLSAIREELSGTSIAADALETLWVVDDMGDLHERSADGAWSWWRLPEPVARVDASEQNGGLWLSVGDDLWFHYGEGYGPLETAISGEFMGVDSDGRALVVQEDGLWAIGINDVTAVVIEDPPTWAVDVEPVFIESCEPCHGKGAYAHPLFEPEQWIAEIDSIVFMVTEPAWQPQMPLAPYPPLDNAAVQVIMDWRDAGFPE